MNYIKLYHDLTGALVDVDNDIIVGRSHLANKLQLITPLSLTPETDIIQVYFKLANNQLTPKREMTLVGTETVSDDVWNVYEYAIPSSVLAVITGVNSNTLQVQFRHARLVEGVYTHILATEMDTLTINAAINLDPEDDVIYVDEYDDLVAAIAAKQNKDWSLYSTTETLNDDDYFTIANGSEVSNRVTVAKLTEYLAGDYSDLDTRVTTLEGNVDQDVSIGSSPHFTKPTVDKIDFRKDEAPDEGITEELDYDNVKTIKDNLSHFTDTDNPHEVDKTDVGLGNVDNTSDADKPISDATQTALNDKANAVVGGYVPNSEKGVANGVATLDTGGKVPASQLPSYVDDVEEYATLSAFPTTGEAHKIYIATDTRIIYRWTGSAYANLIGTAEQTSVDASVFTKILSTDAVNVLLALQELDLHTHTESDITDLDKYTQSETDALLAGKIDVGSLSSSLTLYPTNTYEVGGTFDGYAQMVSRVDDARYNDTEVILYTTDDRTETGTSVITSNDPDNPSLVGALVADAGLFIGDVGIINTNTIGQVRRVSGGLFTYPHLRYKIFHSDDMVNPICTSGWTDTVSNAEFEDVFQSGIMSNVAFELDDRLVIHYEAYKSNTGTDPIVAIIFGGESPTRTLLPIPVSATNQASLIAIESITGLTATQVQEALEQLKVLLDSNITVTKIQRFVITNADNGDGTFSYTYGGDARTGTLTSGVYRFTLEDDVEYVVGANRTEIKINNDTAFYPTDLEVNEIDTETIDIEYALQVDDEVHIKLHQGMNTVSLEVGDGTITLAKLSLLLQGKISDYDAHLIDTDNPHEVTKVQVGLGNVDNTSDLNKPISTATQTALDDKVELTTYSTTIATTDTWTDQTGYFTLAKTVSGIVSTDVPIVDLDLSGATVSNVADIQTAWGTIYRVVTSLDTVTFYALEEPTFPEDTDITLEVFR